MAELREQMKDTNTQLLTGYSSLSKGINSAFDEAKFRAKEEQHKELIEKTVDTFKLAPCKCIQNCQLFQQSRKRKAQMAGTKNIRRRASSQRS